VALVALLLLLALLGLRLPTPMWSDRQAYLAFLVPRFALWAVLIHYWFRPRGGIAALAIWSALGVALSTGIDLVHRSRDASKHPLVAADDRGRRFGPLERRWMLVPIVHVGVDMSAQSGLAREVSRAE
jgi:hypothetical protein